MCVVILKEHKHHHNIGSPKTDSDHLLKGNLGRYCPKTFEMAKGKKEKKCHKNQPRLSFMR